MARNFCLCFYPIPVVSDKHSGVNFALVQYKYTTNILADPSSPLILHLSVPCLSVEIMTSSFHTAQEPAH